MTEITSPGEEWRTIPGFPCYHISNLGRVKSLEKYVRKSNGQLRLVHEKLISISKNGDGYNCVTLFSDQIRKYLSIHRAIALTFIPNHLNLPVVNHIDGNKENNSISNLEWTTVEENTKHAIRTGLMPKRQPIQKWEVDRLKLRSIQSVSLFDTANNNKLFFTSIKECSAYLNVSPSTVSNSLSKSRLIFNRYQIERTDSNPILVNKKLRFISEKAKTQDYQP